jgi:hypothetical protein
MEIQNVNSFLINSELKSGKKFPMHFTLQIQQNLNSRVIR